MAVERIQLGPIQASGHAALGGAAPVAVNVIVDMTGSVMRRPGLVANVLPSAVSTEPVVGIHVLPTRDFVVMSGDLPGSYTVTRVTAAGAMATLTTLTGETRPVIVETEAAIMWADGRRPNLLRLSTLKVESLGGTPPMSSHIAANSLRILANDVSAQRTQLNYTAPASGDSTAGHEQWNETTSLGTASFVSTEANPEPIVALASNSNEVFAFKKSVSMSFVPDATYIYAPAATREVGCSAPFSIVADDSAYAWLDNRRRIVHSDMRSVEILSDPIQRTLDQMSTVSDAWAFRFHEGPVDALVWVFPADGRAFAYQKGVGWCQWQGQDAGQAVAFPVTSHFHDAETRRNLVGTASGQVAKMTLDAADDFGEAIGAYVQTGYLSHDTSRRKQCLALRLTLERGHAVTEGSSIGVSWRSDGEPWEGPIMVAVGESDDRATTVELRSLGIYRHRQWQFSFHGPEALTLASVEEEFEVLQQ